jgi:hypothetical protein
LKEAKAVIDNLGLAISSTPEDVVSSTHYEIPYEEINSSVNVPTRISKGGRNCVVNGFIIFLVLLTVIPILAAMASSGGPHAGIRSRINPFAVGKVSMLFGEEGSGPVYFTDARFVSVDKNGHISVGEFEGCRVQVFDEQANYITQWKATGNEIGDIYLTGMAADRNSLVYTVVGRQLYGYDGKTSNLPGRYDNPDGWGFEEVTVTPDGSVIAAWY